MRKKYGRAGKVKDDKIILRIRIACCLPKDTNTHTELVTHGISSVTMVTRQRPNSPLYVYCLSYCIYVHTAVNYCLSTKPNISL